MSIFASTWALLVAGLIFALPMLYFRVRNTTTLEEDFLYIHPYCLISCLLIADLV